MVHDAGPATHETPRLMDHSNPIVSIVLPTDTLDTVAPVLERLRRLNAPERIEVILISPAADPLRVAAASEAGFHSVVICPIDTLAPLGRARAAGVLAASAPYVFLGETHSYLWPDALDPLLEPLVRGEADVTVPGFVNGNPTGVTSWASFLVAYARWGAGGQAGPLSDCVPYDFLVRREVLTEAGDSLHELLSDGESLNRMLYETGRRVLFVPDARIDHVNLESWRACLHEYLLAGIACGRQRAAAWSYPRRLAYIAGSGLVPAVLMARSWPGVRRLAIAGDIPPLSIPAMLLLFTAKALGEVAGYAGLARPHHPEMQTHYEVHRLDFASPCQPR